MYRNLFCLFNCVGNILLDEKASGEFTCVICDFGYSNIVGGTRMLARGMKQPQELGFTVRYSPPEVRIYMSIRTYVQVKPN